MNIGVIFSKLVDAGEGDVPETAIEESSTELIGEDGIKRASVVVLECGRDDGGVLVAAGRSIVV